MLTPDLDDQSDTPAAVPIFQVTSIQLGESTPPPTIALLETVNIKKAFFKEAYDFTPWLEKNIEALSQRLNLALTVIAREKAVGSFSLDLLCEDSEGRQVIIENQLEKTDHTHLGQLLTYLVNLDAATAIWITPEPRAEHQKVITWLNESTPAAISFYLVKVEAIRIQGSPYAPLFTVIAGPDHQAKEIGVEKKDWDARKQAQYEFWKSFIELGKSKLPFLVNKTPTKSYFLSVPSGKPGFVFYFNVYAEKTEVDLYIDFRKNSAEKNKQAFDTLAASKTKIDQAVGPGLNWERQDNERASHLRFKFKGGYQMPPSNRSAVQQTMVEAYLRLQSGLMPYIKN